MTYFAARVWVEWIYRAGIAVPMIAGIASRSLAAFLVASFVTMLAILFVVAWLAIFRRCEICGRSRIKLVMRGLGGVFFDAAKHDHDAEAEGQAQASA